ncbi:MAG TPA: hypothetical protein VJT67_16455 [Longimicrobiaceae bacterium]|nr:hypothetical protein [Longimicrobiaceae bacterium]
MKKLVLDADALRVDSFPTSQVTEQAGTVAAFEGTQVKTCANTCHCTSVDIGCWCTEAC